MSPKSERPRRKRARKAELITNTPLLKSLLTSAMTSSQVTQKSLADTIGVDRSQLNRFLNKVGSSLPLAKLSALADALRLSLTEVRMAAGLRAATAPHIDLSDSILAFRKSVPALKIVTDPRFFDSALFTWLFTQQQPLVPVGITCEPLNVHWAWVPETLEEHPRSVGFFNRRSRSRIGNTPVGRVDYWSDLCLYQGYALLARKSLGAPTHPDRREANDFLAGLLRRRQKGNPPRIISMAADIVWKLRTPLNPLLTPERFVVHRVPNPDAALQLFLDGEGDFFVGGLPQRLVAKTAGHVELLTFENNPLLFSVNSLIYPNELLDRDQHARSLLSAMSSLWFIMVNRLRSDDSFRSIACEDIPRMLDDMFGRGRHFVTKQGMAKMLSQAFDSSGDEQYEFLPSRPTDLLDAWARAHARLLKEIADDPRLVDDMNDIVTHVLEILLPEVDGTSHRSAL